MRLGRRSLTALAAAACLALSGCGGDDGFTVGGLAVHEAAIDRIENQLEVRAGLGELDAECPQVTDPAVGVTVECTATTPDGETLTFSGEVWAPDAIEVRFTNLVPADLVGDYAGDAVGLLNDQNDLNLAPDAIDCGDRSRVLDETGTMACSLDAGDGQILDVLLTITDLETARFTVEVTG